MKIFKNVVEDKYTLADTAKLNQVSFPVVQRFIAKIKKNPNVIQ